MWGRETETEYGESENVERQRDRIYGERDRICGGRENVERQRDRIYGERETKTEYVGR